MDFAGPHEEGEADRVASLISGTGRAAGWASTAAGPAPHLDHTGAVRRAFTSPGHAVPDSVQAMLAPHLLRHGATAAFDLGQVRVHTDDAAAQAAGSVGAAAFTVGNHVAFGAGAYRPRTAAGLNLLVHELAHVRQQALTGRRELARAPMPVERLEEKGHSLTRADLEKLQATRYWVVLVQSRFDLLPIPQRMFDDPEELDAVVAGVWSVRPTDPVAAVLRLTLTVPQRGATAPTLLYRATFRPRAAGDPAARESVQLEFLAAGAAAVPVRTESRPSFRSQLTSYSSAGFPGGDGSAYWDDHPQERNQLFHWVERLAPATFDQVVTTQEKARGKDAAPRQTSYKVTGAKDSKGAVTNVTFTYLGSLAPQTVTLPAGYRDKDYADLAVERAQSMADPTLGDTLGILTLPPGISAAERLAVKEAVTRYFDSGTRNAEVDAILPIPGKAAPVLYTLRFRPTNDVDVERIGEQGTGTGQVDPGRLDIARSAEYVGAATDPASLRKWIRTRYPGITPAGDTVEAIRAAANAELDRRAGLPEWFATNYKITVLDAAAAAERLRTTHRLTQNQVADLKEFRPEELRHLEAVLETFRAGPLAKIRYLRIARQRMFLEVGKDGAVIEVPDRGGNTFTSGSSRTVVVYDGALASAGASIFLGGSGDAFAGGSEIFVHELGHVVGGTMAKRAFDAYVRARSIKPVTKYSADHPAAEFFAEAFQLYQTDPEWLRSNQPDLLTWFDTFTTTGRVLSR